MTLWYQFRGEPVKHNGSRVLSIWPFYVWIGAVNQSASSYDEIMHFFAQAIEFNMFYLFYVPIGFNLFFKTARSEPDYKPIFTI